MFLNHKNFSVISDLPGHVFGYSQEPARALRVLAPYCATEVVREVFCVPIVLSDFYGNISPTRLGKESCEWDIQARGEGGRAMNIIREHGSQAGSSL